MVLEDINNGDEILEQLCFEKLVCKRVTPENLNAFDKYSFSMLHLNMRSLNKHHEDLRSLLACMDHKFDIIGCTETWINNYTYLDLLKLDDYILYNKNRTGKSGGGVCIYANKQHTVLVRDDLSIDDEQIDSLFIEIKSDNTSIIAGVIYRPPKTEKNELNNFLVKLEELLDCINKSNKMCFILGDFNINLATDNDNSTKYDFLNCLYSASFFSHNKRVHKRIKLYQNYH